MSRRAAGGHAPKRTAAPEQRRSGMVACLGRTNVGKSTLINRLVGQKLVIVSPKPQTTSRRLRGIVNAPGGQFVIVDTPGLHTAERVLNRKLLTEARRGIAGCDALLAVADLSDEREHRAEESLLRELVRDSRLPTVLAVNKIDAVSQTLCEATVGRERDSGIWSRVVGVSARTGANVPVLIDALLAVLPPGAPPHPGDLLSDQPERDFFSEKIREQVFHELHHELPYSVAVVIDEVVEQTEPHRYRIRATLYVERASQKGILIGEGGRGLRRIGTRARLAIEELTGAPVFLGLWVKVRRNWTRDERALREFGFVRED